MTKAKQADKFTKEQLVSAEKYINRKDILSASLDDEKVYTFEETDALIDAYLKRKV